MPRINEHTFKLENINYKLTYYKNENPIVYINDKMYSGNKTELLKRYIMYLGLDFNLNGLTTQQLSSMVLKHFSGQNNSQNKKISPKASSNKTIQNLPAEKKIEELFKNLDRKKLNDKKTPKLLIIGCCDAKSQQPIGLANGGIVNYNFGAPINVSRNIRLAFYNALPANHFVNRPNGAQAYYLAAQNIANRRQALDVYGSNRSPFYNPAMKALYRLKIQNCNLHLLIVSGLYGIIRHDDYINDYHLGIKKGPNVWGINISNAVSDYIRINNIDNDAIFYSLSGDYLPFLNPQPNWKNLWLNHGGHGHNQANDLMFFLNNIC